MTDNIKLLNIPSTMEVSKEQAIEDASNAVFALINPNNEERLRKCNILKNMDKGGENQLRNPLLQKPLKKALLQKVKETDIVKKKDVVKVNERYMNGHLPKLKRKQDSDCSSDEEEEEEIDSAVGTIPSIFDYFIRSGIVFKKKIFLMASKAGRTWLISLVPTHQISTLTTFFILTYVINAQFLSYFIPLLLFILSLGTMLVATIRMLRSKKRFEEFLQWSTLLSIVVTTDTVDTKLAEENYLLNHISPFTQFWFSSLLAIFAYAARRDIWFFNAELFVLSAIMYISIVLLFKLYANKWNCIVLLSLFFATLLEGFNRFDGYFAGGILISLPVSFLNITLNLSISVLLRGICVFCIYQNFKSSRQRNKLCAFYVDVAPSLVAILWWEFGTLFLAQSSIRAVFRALFEAFSLIFALPFLCVALLSATIYFVASVNITKVLLTFVLIAFPLAYARFMKTDWKKTLYKVISNTAVQVALTVACVLLVGVAMLYYNPAGLQVKDSKLNWKSYQNVCVGKKDWAKGNYAQISMVCEEFKGYHIYWKGTVKSVQMVLSENKLRTLLDHLPGCIANWMACIYGNHFPATVDCDSKDTVNRTNVQLCKIAKISERECYTFDYNSYTFRITVAMTEKVDFDDAPTLALEVGNDFKDLVFSLQHGDRIGFKGVIASTNPTIQGKAIYKYTQGTEEPEEYLKKIADIKQALDLQLRNSINFILRFLFFPLIVFD